MYGVSTWQSIPPSSIDQGIDRVEIDWQPTIGCVSLATLTDNRSTIGRDLPWGLFLDSDDELSGPKSHLSNCNPLASKS